MEEIEEIVPLQWKWKGNLKDRTEIFFICDLCEEDTLISAWYKKVDFIIVL